MVDNNQSGNMSKTQEQQLHPAHGNTVLKKQVRAVTCNCMSKLVRGMMAKSDDVMFDFVSQIDSRVQQNEYIDAMREARYRRKSIEDIFAESLKNSFSRFDAEKALPSSALASKAELSTSLALIDDQSVDENMAISNMAEKQERLFNRELHELALRIKVVYGCRDIENNAHPLSPVTIANAIGDALRPQEIKFQVKLIIFKFFDHFVMSNLGHVYKEINMLLIREGVLPKLRYSVRRSTSIYRPYQTHNTDAHHKPMTGHEWDTVDTHTEGILPNGNEAIAPLLSTDFGLQGFTPMPRQNIGVIGTLTAMQNFVSQHEYPAHIEPTAIGEGIINGIQSLGFASVQGKHDIDEKVITLVSKIFDFILKENGIPKQIKNLLSKLQIPFLKLALLDRSFLLKNDHPARKLLNDMVKASIGWDYSRIKSNLFSEIDSIVDIILEKYEQDVNVFDELLERFNEYWSKEQEINHSYEERTWKTTEGKERVQYAKSRVNAWVHMWCLRSETRPQVSTFLNHIWKNTMLYCMHKFGENSREWRYYIKLIECLIWSTTPGKNEDEVKQLIKVTPPLIRGLNRGMLAVATHPNTIATVFDEFSKCHLGIIEKGLSTKNAAPDRQGDDLNENSLPVLTSIFTQETKQELEKPELEVDDELEEATERFSVDVKVLKFEKEEDIIRDEFHDQAMGLEVGTWIEFDTDDGIEVSAKLAWKSTLTSNLLFVGHDGLRFAEKTIAEIAEDLRTESARLISQEPVFDRALSAVAQ